MRQPTELSGQIPVALRGRMAATGAAARLPLRVEWGLPPTGVPLPADEVHIALTRIERPEWPIEELTELLSTEERVQVGKFRFDADRRRYAVGRGMLRLWLSRYLNRAPQELAFRYGPNGKPQIEDERGIHFNLSHSGGIVAYAATRAGEIGIDLERVHELVGWEQISVLCFAPEERALISAQTPEERLAQFFRLWTRHEAWLKAWGAGLGGTAVPKPGEDAWSQPGAAGALETFVPAPGYIASVAVVFAPVSQSS
jgi:4'-phosphopantetheinyl transferase